MAFYLRDQHVKNVSTDSEALTQINTVFAERFTQLEAELAPKGKKAFFTYIIRFDNKGYRVFKLDELMRYFNQANEVDRIIFTIESDDSISSGRHTGAFLELCLDAKEPTRNVLIASSDNKDWTETSFAAVHEILGKYRTKYGLFRSPGMSLGAQIFGVIIGFVVSIWLAFRISPNLKIENSFIIAFLFTLLVFSNIWGYLNQALLGFIAKTFPNIEFVRPAKARLHWLLQAIVGSAMFAVIVYSLDVAFLFLSKFLSGFFSTGA